MISNIKNPLKVFSQGALIAGLLLAPMSNVAYAQFSSDTNITIETGEVTLTPPPVIRTLFTLEVDEADDPYKEGFEVGLDIRRDALKEAALSYGARGGMAFRTYEIRQELEDKARYLDKVFNFRQLLIKAPSGFLIEPPVVSEADNNVLINGLEAAVTDRMYNINSNVKFVSAPKTWRLYLDREWGEVTPPPNILRPINDEERRIWVEKIEEGWIEGYQQAEEIFESDLALLLAEYRGMVRYRVLLAQGMISEPFTALKDRGITGGGSNMRIGDRAVQIIDVPQLIPESAEWSPENR